MKNKILLTLAFSFLAFIQVFSQKKLKVMLDDTVLSVNDTIIFNHFSYKVLYPKDIKKKYSNHRQTNAHVNPKFYGAKLRWYFLSDHGIVFEVDMKKKYITSLRVLFNQDELISNKIEGVSSFQGYILFFGDTIMNSTTLGQLKQHRKIEFPADCREGIRYLYSSSGDMTYHFHFDGYSDNSKITQIIVTIPDYKKFGKSK